MLNLNPKLALVLLGLAALCKSKPLSYQDTLWVNQQIASWKEAKPIKTILTGDVREAGMNTVVEVTYEAIDSSSCHMTLTTNSYGGVAKNYSCRSPAITTPVRWIYLPGKGYVQQGEGMGGPGLMLAQRVMYPLPLYHYH